MENGFGVLTEEVVGFVVWTGLWFVVASVHVWIAVVVQPSVGSETEF